MRGSRWLCLALALPACGGEDAGGSVPGETAPALTCDEVLAEDFVPCGGDVVGTWEQLGCQELASPIAMLEGACSGQAPGTSVQTYRTLGYRIHRADGTYLANGATELVDVQTMPIACESCSVGTREVRAEDGSLAGYEECRADGDDCVCTGRELYGGASFGGTYRVEGSTFSSEAGVPFAYCRDGDRLTLDLPRTPIDGHPGATVRTRVVLTLLPDAPPASPAG